MTTAVTSLAGTPPRPVTSRSRVWFAPTQPPPWNCPVDGRLTASVHQTGGRDHVDPRAVRSRERRVVPDDVEDGVGRAVVVVHAHLAADAERDRDEVGHGLA